MRGKKKKDKHKKLYKWLYGCGKDPKDSCETLT